MAARTSSAAHSAPAEYSSPIAELRRGFDHWKAQLAQMDWQRFCGFSCSA